MLVLLHLDKHQVRGFGVEYNLNAELNFSFSVKILTFKVCIKKGRKEEKEAFHSHSPTLAEEQKKLSRLASGVQISKED